MAAMLPYTTNGHFDFRKAHARCMDDYRHLCSMQEANSGALLRLETLSRSATEWRIACNRGDRMRVWRMVHYAKTMAEQGYKEGYILPRCAS